MGDLAAHRAGLERHGSNPLARLGLVGPRPGFEIRAMALLTDDGLWILETPTEEGAGPVTLRRLDPWGRECAPPVPLPAWP